MEIANTWKESLDQRGGIENVKTLEVHTFLQHLVTFRIVKDEDFDLYKKFVIGSAWRKHMPKLAVSLGLGDKMPAMIEELISRGQQVDAVHFTRKSALSTCSLLFLCYKLFSRMQRRLQLLSWKILTILVVLRYLISSFFYFINIYSSTPACFLLSSNFGPFTYKWIELGFISNG